MPILQVLQNYQKSTCEDDWRIIHGLLPGNNV